MFVKEIISETFSPLSLSDTGISALNLMDEFKVTQMPLVDGARYYGLISDIEIYNFSKPEDPIINSINKVIRPYISHENHILEALKIIVEEKLNLLPVLDEKENFIGVVQLPQLIKAFSELIGLDNPGAIIVLEMNINDYSMVEIAQIVESNDLKILSSYICTHKDSTKAEVTLKLNTVELRPLIQTFNRYNYSIKATYMEHDDWQDMRDRYDYVMNYLNI